MPFGLGLCRFKGLKRTCYGDGPAVAVSPATRSGEEARFTRACLVPLEVSPVGVSPLTQPLKLHWK